MRFAKLQGSGNDFVVIDNRDGKVEEFLRSLNLEIKEFVKKVCAFHTGVGADGLILIENPENPENHFKWQFFNADGSVAEMCGNGSRCAVRFAFDEGIVGKEVRFETLAGVIKAYVLERWQENKGPAYTTQGLQRGLLEFGRTEHRRVLYKHGRATLCGSSKRP